MAVRRKRKGPTVNELLGAIATKIDQTAAMALVQLHQVEMERDRAVDELAVLKARLNAILTPDQREAAAVCGVSMEVYAINLIEMVKSGQLKSFDPRRAQVADESRYSPQGTR